ncbi:hypothetical protein BgiMline_025130 [Biomphalaria glabrata]|nr:glycosyltransferase family 92 protein F13G3.3 [Biomphalaria glabrata]
MPRAPIRCNPMSIIPIKTFILLKSTVLMILVIIVFWSMPRSRTRSWSRASIAETYRNILTGQNKENLIINRNRDLARRRVEIEVPEDTRQEPETFQQVNNYEAWVYSAFFDIDVDAPGQDIVKVFGISSYSRYMVYCYIVEDGLTEIVTGKRDFISDNHLQNNSAVILFCPLKTGSKPQFVSIAFQRKEPPTNNLTIVYQKRNQREMTVCHSVLFNVTDPSQLVQSIEMNRLLGAQHFFIYNHSVTQRADRALRHYQKLGLVTVMNWPLPTPHVWYHGQNMAINDCVYRNRGLSTFVAIIDTDEVVVPKNHYSMVEVLHAVDHEVKLTDKMTKKQTIVGSYVFQSTIFTRRPTFEQWEAIKKQFLITPEEDRFIQEQNVTYLTQLIRISTSSLPMVRSKSIVRPEHVLVAGIHFTHFHRGKANFTLVNNNLAILHHYKNYEKGRVIELTAFRFKKKLLTRLKTAYSLMK